MSLSSPDTAQREPTQTRKEVIIEGGTWTVFELTPEQKNPDDIKYAPLGCYVTPKRVYKEPTNMDPRIIYSERVVYQVLPSGDVLSYQIRHRINLDNPDKSEEFISPGRPVLRTNAYVDGNDQSGWNLTFTEAPFPEQTS